jgi:hypothetical protein
MELRTKPATALSIYNYVGALGSARARARARLAINSCSRQRENSSPGIATHSVQPVYTNYRGAEKFTTGTRRQETKTMLYLAL